MFYAQNPVSYAFFFYITLSLVVVVVVVVCVLGETISFFPFVKGNKIRLNLMFLCCYFFFFDMEICYGFSCFFILLPLESLNKMENQLNPFSYYILRSVTQINHERKVWKKVSSGNIKEFL